jgi:hypothetical protein
MAAVTAAGWLDLDVLPGGLSGFQQVFQVVLHVVAGQLQLVRNGGRRPGLPEHLGDLLANGHPTILPIAGSGLQTAGSIADCERRLRGLSTGNPQSALDSR